jgi:cation transport ATPase
MGQKGLFFDAVVFLTMFLLLGRLIEAFSKAKAGDVVTLLGSLRPTEAMLVESSRSPVEKIDNLEI